MLALALAAGPGAGYPDEPPPAHTGGFGEPTCHVCHYGTAPNPPMGELRILGLPEHYAAGKSYEITIVLRGDGLARAGFQLAARFTDGQRRGLQAGAFLPTGADATITAAGDPAIEYAHQTLAGTRPAKPGQARWTLRWEAPEDVGSDVSFHVTANAADDDASPFGDHVYADSARIPPVEVRRGMHDLGGERTR